MIPINKTNLKQYQFSADLLRFLLESLDVMASNELAMTIYTTFAFIMLPVLCLFIEIPLLISILKQFYCTNAQRISSWNKCASILVFIFNVIGNAFMISKGIVSISVENDSIPWIDPLLNTIAVVSLSISTYFVYAVLLLRVHYTFQDSIYRIKTWKLYLHGLNAIISMISVTVVIISTATIVHMSLYSSILNIVWIISLTVGYTHLLYTFNHNLFSLVLEQRQSIFAAKDESGETRTDLNQRQRNMLSTVRKHTILGSCMISSNLLCTMTTVIYVSLMIPFESNLTVALITTSIYCIPLYMFGVAGPACIYLGFKQNKNLYKRFCKICDRKCERICIGLAERRMNEPTDYVQMIDNNIL